MQSTEQLSSRTLAAGAGQNPVEGETRYQSVQEDVVVAAAGVGSESGHPRHHHRRAASAYTFLAADTTTRDKPRPPPLALTPLPTIETILSTPLPPLESLHAAPYKTTIHTPSRRTHIDPDTLEELLRAADRLRALARRRTPDVPADVDMPDYDAPPSVAFRTAPGKAAEAYPSPPPSSLSSLVDVWFTPPVSGGAAAGVLEFDEMEWDWDWGADGDGDVDGDGDGDVVYGAAGVALSPRAMAGGGGCRCCCRCGGLGLGLYDIAEESEEEEEG